MTDTSSTSELSRRTLLTGQAAASLLTAPTAPASAQTPAAKTTAEEAQAALKDARSTKLVLLGTSGGPGPGRTRRMTSHVMLSNGAAYVLDCGLGVTDQFARTGIPFAALRSIFITHHHADHISSTARSWWSAGSTACMASWDGLCHCHLHPGNVITTADGPSYER